MNSNGRLNFLSFYSAFSDVTVQSGNRRLQQIQNHAESVRSLGVSIFQGDTVAVTDRKV